MRDRKAYHVEYGYSCMGYEVPASIGIRLADESRDVFAMVGDGGYLMMPTELVTAVQERVKVIVVLVQNHGFHSIGSLSESLGSQRFGTSYRFRGESSGRLDGDVLPVDLAANARSPRGARHRGALARRAATRRSRRPRPRRPTADPSSSTSRPTRSCYAPDSASWWDVPVCGGQRPRLDADGIRASTSTTRPPSVPLAPPRAPDRLTHGVRVMKLALDPYMFRETPLLELPALVADLGYEWIELSPRDDFIPFFNHPRVDDAGVAAFRKALAVGGGRRLVGAAALPVVRARRGGPAGGGALLEARHPDRSATSASTR